MIDAAVYAIANKDNVPSNEFNVAVIHHALKILDYFEAYPNLILLSSHIPYFIAALRFDFSSPHIINLLTHSKCGT